MVRCSLQAWRRLIILGIGKSPKRNAKYTQHIMGHTLLTAAPRMLRSRRWIRIWQYCRNRDEMIGRPNLDRLHCDRFRLLFHIQLAEPIGSQALSESFSFTDDHEHEVTLYGKAYHSGGLAVVVDGEIFRHDTKDFHVSLTFTREDRGKPPRDIKSPGRLMNLILSNAPPSPVSINAYATFRYMVAEGWRSFVPVELPSPFKTARGIAFTHVDVIQLSNVDDAKAREWVGIKSTDEGALILDVGMRRERVINRGLIGSLLREGSRLSSSCVTQEETSDGD